METLRHILATNETVEQDRERLKRLGSELHWNS